MDDQDDYLLNGQCAVEGLIARYVPRAPDEILAYPTKQRRCSWRKKDELAIEEAEEEERRDKRTRLRRHTERGKRHALIGGSPHFLPTYRHLIWSFLMTVVSPQLMGLQGRSFILCTSIQASMCLE